MGQKNIYKKSIGGPPRFLRFFRPRVKKNIFFNLSGAPWVSSVPGPFNISREAP